MKQISKEADIASSALIGEGVVIEGHVKVEESVRIGHNTVIHDNVFIREGTIVGNSVVLGERLSSYYKEPKKYENPPLEIGKNSIIRSGSIIYAGSKFGERFQTGCSVVVREQSKFGVNNSLGTLSQVEGYNEIGDHNRFHCAVHLPFKTKIHNFVWVFPYVVFTTDIHPPCGDCIRGPNIEDFALVGTHSVIMPGVRIGRNSIVAAMSLVTKDVPPEKVVMGVPAKVVKSVHDIECTEVPGHPKPYPWFEMMDPKRKRKYGYPVNWEV
ncbi:MAG: DapH/DapD/GlmU-related protein [Candidatus Thermoplasmatota archaeon]